MPMSGGTSCGSGPHDQLNGANPRRGRGRPPKGELAKRGNLKIRMREELRALIEEQARRNGRSASEEAEVRLERSFREDEILKRLDEIASRLK